MRTVRIIIVLVVLACCARARASTVQELTRINGQGEYILRGVGLVIGLAGTGDSTKDLALARPLVAMLRNNGQDIGLPEDLARNKNDVRSIALVSVTCIIPKEGARSDDKFDVQVSTVNACKSLAGGELYLTSMQGALPGSKVYAIAAGRVEIEDEERPTSGRVRSGARMVRDVLMPDVGNTFDLIIEPPFAGWTSATTIAEAIQSNVALGGRVYSSTPRIAQVIDERTVRVIIPEEERADRAAFLTDVMAAEVRTELLELPAQVIVNKRTGAIIVTGDVQISPVAITHKDLSITTVTPPIQPSVQNPRVSRDRWADVKTGARASESAKLSDLLTALKQLDIPVEEQINIIQMLHKTGKLHARLVMD
jgi:flagellar P-ring protein precursor FlgI